MADGQTDGLPREPASLSLPDFCAAGAVLVVVLISELVAMVLTLARAGIGYDVPFWVDLARNSLFLLWIGLLSAAVLCYGRPLLGRLSVAGGTTVALLMLLFVTAIVSELAWWADRYWAALLQPTARPGAGGHLVHLARNLLICLIVSVAALRYFYVSDQWRRNVELEATARVNALQARIRPHFLFNSMNTIASLTRSSPELAEEAVEDLAELFRASLADADNRVCLGEELEISRVYQRIEQHRLGDRLTVHWDVDALPPDAEIPSLSVQPLLENAIHHGIEPRPQGGTVHVVGRLIEGDMIEITITNPLPDAAAATSTEGNRMALLNIRERFRLAWQGRAVVDFGRTGDEYRVSLRFPAGDSPSRSARPVGKQRTPPGAPADGEPVA